MKIYLFLVVVAISIGFANSYGQEIQETPSIIITEEGQTEVNEIFDVRTTISRFDVIPIGKIITDVIAFDENNIVLKTTFEETKIRIESLGASKVTLHYNTDIITEENGLWKINYTSEKETTLFLPTTSELVSVNTIPIAMKEDQIVMPPGNISVTYTQKSIVSHNFILDENSTMEVMTLSGIENFGIDKNEISFLFDEKNTILLILPKSFLKEIPQIQINNNTVELDQYYQNSTHHWIGVEPFEAGSLQIIKPAILDKLISEKTEEKSILLQDIPESENLTQTPQMSTEGGGCLIATAAYGSEMASQVQMLRELRDQQILQTNAGLDFMKTFNSVYYVISPTIADWERENPLFRETVKIAITPMISSLSLLQISGIDSEKEVLVYGGGIVFLNLVMYVAAPVFLIIKLRYHLSKHPHQKREQFSM